MEQYECRHNDCRMCTHLRKPTLWARLMDKVSPREYVGVCHLPNLAHVDVPVTHDENGCLPCSYYTTKEK